MKKPVLLLFKILAVGCGIVYASAWIVFLGFIAFVACANFYSNYIHNWGYACNAFKVMDSLSPSKQWIARRQEIGCSSLTGGLSIEVVLVRSRPLFPFLAPEHLVFERELESNDPVPLDVKWVDEKHITLTTAPCKAEACKFATPVKGIKITVVSP
jgi:hypothetical protein